MLSFGQLFEFKGFFQLSESRNADDVFESAKMWFSNKTFGVNKRLLYINSDTGVLSGKFDITFRPNCNMPKCIRAIGIVDFVVSIKISEKYCVYKFTDFIHTGSENVPGGAISFGKITEDSVCPYENIPGGRNWKDEQWQALKNYATNKIKELKTELQLSLVGNQ